MTGTILTVGALGLDTIFRLDALPLAPGKHLPIEAVQVAQGMATAQAATIVRLGGRARLWASIGDDATGERIAAELAAAGIDLSALRRLPGARSGFSSILVDAAGERVIVPQYDAALRAPPTSLPRLDDVAVVSVDVRWPTAAELALRAARERGLPAVLDVEAAPRDVLDPLLALATHIVASEGGALALTGAPPKEAAALLARQWPAEVIVTAGPRGAFWRGGHVPAPPVASVDTLAAGDVFHGAFALLLAEGRPLPEILRFAATAAALKCSRFGGRLGAPTRAEVEALL